MIIGASVGSAVALAIIAAVLGFGIPKIRLYLRLKNAPRDESSFVIVFTDIESSTPLWAFAPTSMGRGLDTHNEVIRKVLADCEGYEVKTIGDSFMCAFKDEVSAVKFSLEIQSALHKAAFDPVFDDYYKDFTEQRGLSLPNTEEEYQALWAGIRVRVGIHSGPGTVVFDDTQQIYDYYGSVVNTASRIESVGHGGQIIVSEDVLVKLASNEQTREYVYNMVVGQEFDPTDSNVVVTTTTGEGASGEDKNSLVFTHRSTTPPPKFAISDMRVLDLGARWLKGVPNQTHLFQLSTKEYAAREFPGLRLDRGVDEDGGDDEQPLGSSTTDSRAGGTKLDIVENIFQLVHSAAATEEEGKDTVRSKLSTTRAKLLSNHTSQPPIIMYSLEPHGCAKIEKLLSSHLARVLRLPSSDPHLEYLGGFSLKLFHGFYAALEVLSEANRASFIKDCCRAWRISFPKEVGDTEHEIKQIFRIAVRGTETLGQRGVLLPTLNLRGGGAGNSQSSTSGHRSARYTARTAVGHVFNHAVGSSSSHGGGGARPHDGSPLATADDDGLPDLDGGGVYSFHPSGQNSAGNSSSGAGAGVNNNNNTTTTMPQQVFPDEDHHEKEGKGKEEPTTTAGDEKEKKNKKDEEEPAPPRSPQEGHHVPSGRLVVLGSEEEEEQ